MEKPRTLSVVRLSPKGIEKIDSLYDSSEFGISSDGFFVFLGEIPNMPGHCVVANKDGVVKFGYHTEYFVEVPE